MLPISCTAIRDQAQQVKKVGRELRLSRSLFAQLASLPVPETYIYCLVSALVTVPQQVSQGK
jgi:hypothetical protein